MDSIYKRYPFGSLLFWRTKAKLAIERKLGAFDLPNPKKDYPIDYVLQQFAIKPTTKIAI